MLGRVFCMEYYLNDVLMTINIILSKLYGFWIFPDALSCWRLRKDMKILFLHFEYEEISLIAK